MAKFPISPTQSPDYACFTVSTHPIVMRAYRNRKSKTKIATFDLTQQFVSCVNFRSCFQLNVLHFVDWKIAR